MEVQATGETVTFAVRRRRVPGKVGESAPGGTVPQSLTPFPSAVKEVDGDWRQCLRYSTKRIAVQWSNLGSIANWLNPVNQATSHAEAWTGPGIVERGFASIEQGGQIEFEFAADELVNRPGIDLAVFEARFDAGAYEFTTSFDGHVASFTLDELAFVATGETRSYFNGGNGPYGAEAFGVGVDLSDLGVPAGVAVQAVRLVAISSDQADLLGVGAAVDADFETFCTTSPNSTGVPSFLSARGTADVARNDLVLQCTQLPPDVFGYVITSLRRGAPSMMPGVTGEICLAGAVGRFIGPGQVMNSGSDGRFELAMDWNSMPQPNGFVVGMAGEAWHFHAWSRDFNPAMGPTSKISNALAVTLR